MPNTIDQPAAFTARSLGSVASVNAIHAHDLQATKNKARYGHRNWLWWQDRSGRNRAAIATRETMKQCLLECGTEAGSWYFVNADCGTLGFGTWAWGVVLLRNFKYLGRNRRR